MRTGPYPIIAVTPKERGTIHYEWSSVIAITTHRNCLPDPDQDLLPDGHVPDQRHFPRIPNPDYKTLSVGSGSADGDGNCVPIQA